MKRPALSFIALFAMLFAIPAFSYAQTVADLQREIDEHAAQIQQIDAEIAKYEAQLKTTSAQKQTLQTRVGELDLQRKKLTAEINKTRAQISTTQKQITQLQGGIENKEVSIEANRAGLAESLRIMRDADQQPLVMTLLSQLDLADAWQMVDSLEAIQGAVHDDIQNLAAEKQSLTDTKTAAEEKRAQLARQQATLTSQQGSLDATRRAQNELLAQTKSQESAYQKILADKQTERKAFEAALFELASKIEYTLDPSKIPSSGKIFRWPLDNVFVTQQFGRTSSSGRLYASGTHDGIDLRASIGTPVKAVLSGTVQEVNYGATRNCQYGKWVIVRHGNGLATLYAHLSEIHVSEGQAVGTGATLGYAGDTGYATGPHLHFTVYLSDALTFKSYKCKNGTVVTVPIAPTNAYMNPLQYLQ